MKKALVFLLMLCLGLPALALDRPELDTRILKLATKLDVMQQKPDKAIPPEYLRKAHGIVLLDRTKAGFLFAYQGGSGAAMIKDAAGKWSPVAFVSANEASLGFQIGGEQTFVVILLMDTNATQMLFNSNLEVGGEARGTAGDVTTAAKAKITDAMPSILVYDDRKGLYGGAAVKAGAISPDAEANRIYYNQVLNTREILFERKVETTETAATLGKKIDGYGVPATESNALKK